MVEGVILLSSDGDDVRHLVTVGDLREGERRAVYMGDRGEASPSLEVCSRALKGRIELY